MVRRVDLLAQAAAIAVVLVVLGVILATTRYNLSARGIQLGLDFLVERAGFTVAETLLPYDPGDSVLRAMWVGVTNSLFVSIVVGVASTILGVLVGVCRLSPNPMVAGLARVWVEGVRNTPPVLLLIFLYSLWWQVAPSDHAVALAPGVLASIRGLAVPKVTTPWSGMDLLLLAVLAGGLAWLVARPPRAARAMPRPFLAGAAIAVTALAALMLGLDGRAGIILPRAEGATLASGAVLTPELFTILFGLTLYTTGFIAEVVRGGIEAVPKGQWEAARALGLGEASVLRLVVLPQMLRVVIPPMTSQYVNIVKNSTLALAVGYTDFLTIMGTIINKTGHAIEGTVLIVVVYLCINLTISTALNLYNARIAMRGGR
uniref:ABC transporter permease subunit n=1 Tax=uncultured Caulobacter sp. TaxID=158749 RepID=UPI0025FE7EE2|nr:ABC transporter permease subunit [uncultured Caulobacter sp.]